MGTKLQISYSGQRGIKAFSTSTSIWLKMVNSGAALCLYQVRQK